MNDLRYSDRKRLAEQGSLGPLRHDEPSVEFRKALVQVVHEMQHRAPAGATAYSAFANHWRQHFGLSSGEHAGQWITFKASYTAPYRATAEDLLDLIEILVEEARKVYAWKDGARAAAWPDIDERINRLLQWHRFGYRLEGAEIRRVGSPALDKYVVEPALQAVHRPGWEQAERSFREALNHQRGGPDERDDALTAATAALEAALKVAGLRGDRLSALAKSLRNSDLVPGQLKEVPDALDTLLKRSGAIRDPFSDAHGKDPEAAEVPNELVDLAIYWTGAFINYLAAAADARTLGSQGAAA